MQETGRIITLMYPIMVIHIWVPDTNGLTYLRNIRQPMPIWNVAQFPIMAAAVISVAAAILPTAGIPPVRAVTANLQPTITIPELTPFLRANQFPMSPQSLPRPQIQAFLPRPPQQQAPPPASPPWPPALPPATRKRPAPKVVTSTPSRRERNVLKSLTTVIHAMIQTAQMHARMVGSLRIAGRLSPICCF